MEYKFFAFISYSHHDMAAAKKLQSMLEHYNLPTSIRKQKNLPRRFTIFRDRDELTAGPLTDILRNRLEESKYLIVVSSPASAKSTYVGNEISYFRSLGRGNQIISFIVDGEPHGKDNDCLHPQLLVDNPEQLGIQVDAEELPFRFMRFHKAFIRLVAKLLDLNFGKLWNRRKIYVAKLCAYFTMLFSLLLWLAVSRYQERPLDMHVMLLSYNKSLPLSVHVDDSLCLLLTSGDVRTRLVDNLNEQIVFHNIPGCYRGHKVRLYGKIYGFEKVDTMIVVHRDVDLQLKRIPETYGHLHYFVYDSDTEKNLSSAIFDFGFLQASTDTMGELLIDIPIQNQKDRYSVHISKGRQQWRLKYADPPSILYPTPHDSVPAILYVEKVMGVEHREINK